MRRSKAIEKAIKVLEIDINRGPRVCSKCSGTGKWVFFKKSGLCTYCNGIGMVGGTVEQVDQINNYIEYHLDVDAILGVL